MVPPFLEGLLRVGCGDHRPMFRRCRVHLHRRCFVAHRRSRASGLDRPRRIPRTSPRLCSRLGGCHHRRRTVATMVCILVAHHAGCGTVRASLGALHAEPPRPGVVRRAQPVHPGGGPGAAVRGAPHHPATGATRGFGEPRNRSPSSSPWWKPCATRCRPQRLRGFAINIATHCAASSSAARISMHPACWR